MSAEEINTTYTPEQLEGFGFQTVGVVVLGDTTFLLKRNKDALFAMEPVNQNNNLSYFKKQTERLSTKNRVEIPEVDATQVEFLQIDPQAPLEVAWVETVSGADKPEISIPVKNAISFGEKKIELDDETLSDLFLPEKDLKAKQAVFFTMTAADQEVIGIAIRGEQPKLIMIPTALDTGRQSTIAGLSSFLEGVYLKLKDKTTDIQKLVDSQVFEASLPTNGKLVFAAESSKKSLVELHKLIYQIQALLISRSVDGKLGTQDEKILNFAPFMVKEEKQSGLAALLSQSKKPQNLVIDGTIWTKLNAPMEKGFIKTSPRRPSVNYVQPAVKRPVPATSVKPVAQEAPRQLTEKQKAILLSKELDTDLYGTFNMFKDFGIDGLGLKQVQEMDVRLETLSKEAEKYTIERKRGRAPVTPAPSRVVCTAGTMNVGGVKDSEVFGFLTGDAPVTDIKQKIEAVFEIWQKVGKPIFDQTKSRQERLLSQISQKRISNEVSTQLMPVLQKISKEKGGADLYSGELTYLLLAHQVTYCLWSRLQELKKSGTEVEIDNHINYCYATIDRLKAISSEMTSR